MKKFLSFSLSALSVVALSGSMLGGLTANAAISSTTPTTTPTTSVATPSQGSSTPSGKRIMVNSARGINLRGATCNRFGSMPNGAMATLKQKVGYCDINGVRYQMLYVQFDNGTRANVAEALVKYM